MVDPLAPLIARVHGARDEVRRARRRYVQCVEPRSTACDCHLHRAQRELTAALEALQEAMTAPSAATTSHVSTADGPAVPASAAEA